MYRSLTICICCFLIGFIVTGCQSTVKSENQNFRKTTDLETQVFSLDSAQVIDEAFGKVKLFASGKASTYGTKDVATGILNILPNSEAHPPHKHAEEEYLMVTKGSGIWSINGKEFAAKAGDLLYAAPWDLHGIFNSDTVNLEFFFVKWNNKGIPIPKEK